MDELRTAVADVLLVIHVVTAVLLAWPLYALVVVNQRARLGPPLGDRVDTLLENTIKNRTVPCYVFQATVLVSGLGLLAVHGAGLGALTASPALGLKFVLLIVVAAVLSYVSLQLQPAIDAGLATSTGEASVVPETAAAVTRLRLRRKRLASVCLFAVLTAVVLGVRAAAAYPDWLGLALILVLGLFVIRAYRTVTPYGWV